MASKYIQKFPVPEGFSEILHDLTKEILRNQPDDIIEFSVQYFKCLQEGLVLDYQKKGKNIPCDFRASVPQTSTKEKHNAGRKQISREDDDDHAAAVKRTHHINDAAKVHFTETNKDKSEEDKLVRRVELPAETSEIKEHADSREEHSIGEEDKNVHERIEKKENVQKENNIQNVDIENTQLSEENRGDISERAKPELKRLSVNFIDIMMNKITVDSYSRNFNFF